MLTTKSELKVLSGEVRFLHYLCKKTDNRLRKFQFNATESLSPAGSNIVDKDRITQYIPCNTYKELQHLNEKLDVGSAFFSRAVSTCNLTWLHLFWNCLSIFSVYFFFKLDYLTEPTTDKAVSGLFRNLIRRIADTSLLKEMSWSGVAREGSADVQYKYSLKSQPNVVTLICGTGMYGSFVWCWKRLDRFSLWFDSIFFRSIFNLARREEWGGGTSVTM